MALPVEPSMLNVRCENEHLRQAQWVLYALCYARNVSSGSKAELIKRHERELMHAEREDSLARAQAIGKSLADIAVMGLAVGEFVAIWSNTHQSWFRGEVTEQSFNGDLCVQFEASGVDGQKLFHRKRVAPTSMNLLPCWRMVNDGEMEVDPGVIEESVQELRDAGFSAKELRDGGYTAKSLRDARYPAIELYDADYSAREMLEAGYTPKEMRNAGFTLQEMQQVYRENESAESCKKVGRCAAGCCVGCTTGCCTGPAMFCYTMGSAGSGADSGEGLLAFCAIGLPLSALLGSLVMGPWTAWQWYYGKGMFDDPAPWSGEVDATVPRNGTA